MLPLWHRFGNSSLLVNFLKLKVYLKLYLLLYIIYYLLRTVKRKISSILKNILIWKLLGFNPYKYGSIQKNIRGEIIFF